MGLMNLVVTKSAAWLPVNDKKKTQSVIRRKKLENYKSRHTHLHDSSKIWGTEPNHDWVGIAVYDLCVMWMSIGDTIFPFDFLSQGK